MKFQREPMTPVLLGEMLPLWKAHYLETAYYQDIPLEPDIATYEACERMGLLRIYTARLSDRLVGYQIFFVKANPHYMSLLQATQDLLFLDKSCRKGLTGYRFIRWCAEELRKEQVRVVFQHISADHDFGVLLERMGYKRVDVVYGRRLELCQQPSL